MPKLKSILRIARSQTCFAFVCVSTMLLGSCAIGYDSPNGFDVGVSNTQMVNPDSVNFEVNTAGTEATISWNLTMGAKGYEVSFINVDDPDSPKVVENFDKYFVDGSTMTVPVAEDSKYKFEIRTLGEEEYNNTDAAEPKEFDLSTLVPSVATIPSGSDIYQYLTEHPIEGDSTQEVAIDLEPNGEYTMSGQIDFLGQKLTFRGDKIHWPTVRMVEKGSFASYTTFKMKYIKFDLTESQSTSFFYMSADSVCPDYLLSQNRGYMRNGSLIKGVVAVEDPVYFAHCWFKNIPRAFVHDNGTGVAWWHLTITDCICQINNATYSTPFLCLENAGRGIKNLDINNSTIYNVQDNYKAYFIRFYISSSNSNPEKVYGNTTSYYSSQNWNFSHCTFSKNYSGQKWVNNISGNHMALNIDHCIFYDVYQAGRRISMGNKTYSFNFLYSLHASDNGKSDAAYKDDGGAPFASFYDPQFLGSPTQELDLTQPNGGINFTPGEYEILTNRGGDERWLPAQTY